MRALVTVRPKFQLPPDQVAGMTQAFGEWRQRYRGKMEAFYFFASGGGGGGILNTADEAELHQILLEFPFAFFSDMTAEPIVDGDVALKQFQGIVQAMTGGR